MKRLIQIIALAAALLAAAACTSSRSSAAGTTVKYEVSFEFGHTVNAEFAIPQTEDLKTSTLKGDFSYQFSIYEDFPSYIHAQKDPSEKDDVNITLRIYKNNELVNSITAVNEAVLSENICNCQD